MSTEMVLEKVAARADKEASPKMNKCAIITAFLGGLRNRYMTYREDRTLAEKLELAYKIEGCDGVELCYPGDFEDRAELKDLLEKYDLGVSAVNFRARRSGKWWRGSFTSAIAQERQEVVDDFKQAIDYANELGIYRMTTCPLNDGSDTAFGMDYIKAYDYALEALAEIANHSKDTKVCIEFKKNDPVARCIFGTAGETLGFCQLSGADNLGVTLDIGHSYLAQERPAQSAALLAKANRLFYVHLNDNDGYWDWDLQPGTTHLWETVEFLYTIRKLGYRDNWYAFDIFAKELETTSYFNVTMSLTQKLEEITNRIDSTIMEKLMVERDTGKINAYLFSLL